MCLNKHPLPPNAPRRWSPSRRPTRGIILLVVLSMLAFLGVLVVTYVAYSSKSQQASFGIASRQLRQIDPTDVFADAIATLIRGTSNEQSPLYGESLLADLYGIRGAIETCVRLPAEMGTRRDAERPVHVGGGFVRIPLSYLQRELDLSPMVDNVDNLVPGGLVPLFGKNTPMLMSAAAGGRQLFDPAWQPVKRAVALDDYLSGRVLTFRNGPLAGHSYRIIRSVGWRDPAPSDPVEAAEARTRLSVYIELDASQSVTLDNGLPFRISSLLSNTAPQTHSVAALFYARGADGRWGATNAFNEAGTQDDQPYSLVINSPVLNGQGAGFDGQNIAQNVVNTGRAAVDLSVRYSNPSFELPVAFQPGFVNSIWNTTGLTKQDVLGDVDESYDAADFQNWYLSQTITTHDSSTGAVQRRVIPSFHRPALINYIINSFDYSSGANIATMETVVQAIRRATMRPLPLAANDAITGADPWHPRFTGGNNNSALRRPLAVPNPQNLAQMRAFDQFVNALINGPWDVDNDGDGIADSIWLDLGLPIITSREGKLIRPLVAPMIEDLSARLNVNAHGTLLATPQLGLNISEPLAGSTTMELNADVFRGFGFGPAEIVLPIEQGGSTNLHSSATVMSSRELETILRVRHAPLSANGSNGPHAGESDNDLLDVMTSGFRLPIRNHISQGGLPLDPFGRSGLALHRSGRVFAAGSGNALNLAHLNPTPTVVINDNVNDPYELDPTGRLAGDNVFSDAELADWMDLSVFADRGQRSRLDQILGGSRNSNPDLARMLTTVSTSMDVPHPTRAVGDRQVRNTSNFRGADPSEPEGLVAWLARRYKTTGRLTDQAAFERELQTLQELLPRELRLGQKMDLNRPFGNGADDNGNGTVDEPAEVVAETVAFPGVRPLDAFGDTIGFGQQNAIGVTRTVTSDYLAAQVPNATNDFPNGNARDLPRVTRGFNDSRTLFARQLYALMMAAKGDGYEFPLNTNPPAITVDPQDYTARRIAQWAVNVVDFRDSDSIMTAFAYDPNPLDGWTVYYDTDGDRIADIDDEGNAPPAGTPASPIVWGVEAPEMLFSESIAFHDLRIRDTDEDQAGAGDDKMNGDLHTDQIRIPQGSLFLELMSTRARVGDPDDPHMPGVPAELYGVSGTDHYLDIDRTVNTNGAQVPVYRIGISEPHNQGNAKASSAMDIARDEMPDTLSFQPGTGVPLDEMEDDTRDLALERFIFFGQYTDAQLTNVVNEVADIDDEARIFFNRNVANPELYPEHYLTIAPREITRFGNETYVAGVAPTAPSPHRIQVRTSSTSNNAVMGNVVGMSQVNLANTVATPNTTSLTQPGLTLIAAASDTPLTWSEKNLKLSLGTGLPTGVGVNISEPLPRATGYYSEPMHHLDSSNLDNETGFPFKDSYVDYDQAIAAGNSPRNQPADLVTGRPIEELTNELSNGRSFEEPVYGGVLNYRTAFLQRLADPTEPYDPVLNPYRTIDAIELDLEVFSGEDRQSNINPEVLAGRHFRKSRERSGRPRGSTTPSFVLHSNASDPPTGAPLDPTANHYFTLRVAAGGDPNENSFQSTFNFLNTQFGDVLAPENLDGDMNNDITIVDSSATGNRGLPRTPFAMQEWLNREFVSPYELMLVPACSQARLLEEFSLNLAGTGAADNPYGTDDISTAPDPGTAKRPFSHLLNFFQGSGDEADAAHFMRLFECVTTLPHYRGEVDLLTPDRVQPYITLASTGTNSLLHSRKKLRDLFQVPYNKMWDGRRQGRINLNTMSEYPVWMGLMFNHMPAGERASSASTPGTRFQEFLDSRRGYTVNPSGTPRSITSLSNLQAPPYNYDPAALDPAFPSQFAGVMRSPLDSDLNPTVAAPGQIRPGNRKDLQKPDSTAGALRPGVTVNTDPLFVIDGGGGPVHRSRNRSSLMAYQTLMRLPNLVSHQSQTFSVRLTVGFFEVDPVNLWLGEEYNANIGKQQRFKATYIIDRSRPVAFSGPGTDINAEDVILYSRVHD